MDVAKYKGYTITYNPGRKQFGIDAEGEGKCFPDLKTAERRIDSILKATTKKVAVLYVSLGAKEGTLTSYNPDTHEAWVNWEVILIKSGYDRTGREKVNMIYDLNNYLYENTPLNLKIIDDIKVKLELIEIISAEIKALKGALENPINRGYFEKEVANE